EQHDLAGGRQVRHIALEVPLPGLALGRLAERDHTALARIDMLADSVDRPALARAVAAFAQHGHARAGLRYPARQEHQFALHRLEGRFVSRALELAHG